MLTLTINELEAVNAYVEIKNRWADLLGGDKLEFPKDREKLLNELDVDSSPERVSCDGERSATEVKKWRTFYGRVRNGLEKVGELSEKATSEGTVVYSKETITDPAKIGVGTIFHRSWGYSMILHAFYEVVKVTKTGVRVRKLDKTTVGGDNWRPVVRPVPGFYDSRDGGKPKFKRFTKKYDDEVAIKIEGSWAIVWSGEDKTEDHLD